MKILVKRRRWQTKIYHYILSSSSILYKYIIMCLAPVVNVSSKEMVYVTAILMYHTEMLNLFASLLMATITLFFPFIPCVISCVCVLLHSVLQPIRDI